MNSRGLSVTVVACALVIAGTGCRFAVPERKTQSGGPAQKDIALTQNQIRLRMRGLVGPMCGEIEQTADRIVAGTTNHAVQRAALDWKIEAVPVMREALFQPDPLTALIDTWVLCNQMADYFETGPGRRALGDASPIAVAACRRLEDTITQVEAARTVSGHVSTIRAYARQWAAEHPITHSIAGRESALSRVLERDAMGTLSTGEVMADITTSVDDLSRRLDVYSSQLVRQARWEAELLRSELMTDLPLDQALSLAERAVRTAEHASATADRLTPAIERAVVVAEGTPKLIASERETAIQALQAELARTIRFVQEERIAALSHLTQERIAALQTLDERLALERKALVEDLHGISVEVVNHTVWRLALLAGAILVAVFAAAVVLLLLTRRLFPPVKHANS